MKKTYINLFTLLLALLAVAPVAADETGKADRASDDPTRYLEIYEEFDGRCQGLRRGDIRMLRNTHPHKAIEYRMVRLLGGHRQASLIQDVIKPDDKGQRLGCELLDDREQVWKVVRASFVD